MSDFVTVNKEKWGNFVNRLLDNVKDKMELQEQEIKDFMETKHYEIIRFIEDHNDSFFDDVHSCPMCGNNLQFGEDYVNIGDNTGDKQ